MKIWISTGFEGFLGWTDVLLKLQRLNCTANIVTSPSISIFIEIFQEMDTMRMEHVSIPGILQRRIIGVLAGDAHDLPGPVPAGLAAVCPHLPGDHGQVIATA